MRSVENTPQGSWLQFCVTVTSSVFSSVCVINTNMSFSFPEAELLFGQHQESRPLGRSNTGSPRFTNFPSPCAWSEKVWKIWLVLVSIYCVYKATQNRKSAIHGLSVTMRMVRIKSDKSDRWFWSQSIVFSKPLRIGISLYLPRSRDSWCWPKRARPLGTRMPICVSAIRPSHMVPTFKLTSWGFGETCCQIKASCKIQATRVFSSWNSKLTIWDPVGIIPPAAGR